jgi:hypothetical protein
LIAICRFAVDVEAARDAPRVIYQTISATMVATATVNSAA